MKSLAIILTCFLFAMTTNAQEQTDKWQIKWNGKAILSTAAESEKDNVRKVDFNENTVLALSYKEATPKADWARSFLLFDEGDNELLRKENVSMTKIGSEELKKAIGNNKTIRIYTISLPTDPQMAAQVRVRRVHLCTLVLN